MLRRWATPACSGLVVPKTFWASASRSGVYTSSTWRIARMTPSRSRSASDWPLTELASSSGRSRQTGMGQIVPSASRIWLQTFS